jgi:6-phosphogluconolactonase
LILMPEILTFDSPLSAAQACGDRILQLMNAARRERAMATLAVSGGNTPRLMFESMAQRTFDWSGVELFQVDERCVPPDNDQSNYRMMRESLLGAARIPASQIHRIQTEHTPEEAAQLYAEEIRRVLKLTPAELPVFDVIQLGMGPDGHTASLFPGEPLVENRDGLAAAVWVDKFKQHRVSLLPAVLQRAMKILCLVTGADKADALREVLCGPVEPARYPIQLVASEAVWYIDGSVGAKLSAP